MFHVELKQSFNSVRRFNLTREELDRLILVPWLARSAIELDERRYLPEKAKLTILEGPEVRPEEMGMGRGWANAERTGVNATDRILAEARTLAAPSAQESLVEAFKAAVLAAAAERRLALGEIAAMAGSAHAGSRVSEQLALAERSVWELLHQRKLALYVAGERDPLPRERWQPVLLSWAAWEGRDGAAEVEALAPPPLGAA